MICYRQSRRGVARQNSEKCKTIVCIANTFLHTDAFTHKSFYTQKLLHTEAFTQRLLHTKLLPTEAFTYRRFYTQMFLHTDAFTRTLLHTDTFTHRHFYTQTFLHTGAAFTHKRFDTQKLLHIDAFTHRHFYTQTLLHTDAFTHPQQCSFLVTDLDRSRPELLPANPIPCWQLPLATAAALLPADEQLPPELFNQPSNVWEARSDTATSNHNAETNLIAGNQRHGMFTPTPDRLLHPSSTKRCNFSRGCDMTQVQKTYLYGTRLSDSFRLQQRPFPHLWQCKS